MPEAEEWAFIKSLSQKIGASSFASPFRQLLSNHTDGQLRTQCLVAIQHIDAARNRIVCDVVLPGNAHRNAVHHLACAPCAELRYVHQIGAHESEGFRMEQYRLLIKSGGCSTNFGDCSIVSGTNKNVLGCARGDNGW